MSYLGTKDRTLRRDEWKVARSVFFSSLPDYDRIYITNGLGAGERPWTEAVAPIRAIGHEGKPNNGYWRMHLGESGFTDMTDRFPLLIHELTHVWQGAHGKFMGGYMLGSVIAQTVGDGYEYELGKSWGSYNAEQKAEIVEDWYKNGMSDSDPRFRYIWGHIRIGAD